MMSLYSRLLEAALFLLVPLLLGCIVRSVRGPRTADRLMAVNMITTLTILGVCMLAVLLPEEDLADVALIPALLGCLAVVVLTRLRSVPEKKETERRVSPHVD